MSKHIHDWKPLFLPPATPEQKRDAYFDPGNPRMDNCFGCACGEVGTYRSPNRKRQLAGIITVTNTELAGKMKRRADAWNADVSEMRELMRAI